MSDIELRFAFVIEDRRRKTLPGSAEFKRRTGRARINDHEQYVMWVDRNATPASLVQQVLGKPVTGPILVLKRATLERCDTVRRCVFVIWISTRRCAKTATSADRVSTSSFALRWSSASRPRRASRSNGPRRARWMRRAAS